MLPLAEFAYNKMVAISTGLFLFFASFSYHLRNSRAVEEPVQNPDSTKNAHWLRSIHAICLDTLTRARNVMLCYFNTKRSEPKALFPKGHLVMLRAKNIKTRRSILKLDHKLLASFSNEEGLSQSAFSLRLLGDWKIQDVLYIPLLPSFRQAMIWGRPPPNIRLVLEAVPLDEDFNHSNDYTLAKVMDSKWREKEV